MRRTVTIGLVLVVLSGISGFWAVSPRAADLFVGAESCRVCHPSQYEAWKAGPHANATALLGEAHQNDPKCYGCHATRAQSGFLGVQCESCHGGGAHYSRSYIMKDRRLAEAVGLVVRDYSLCLRCHQGDLPGVEPFDPEQFWKRLPHSKTRKSPP